MRPRIATFALLLATFALVPFVALAGGDAVSGHWKFTFLQDGQAITLWLLDFETKDGKTAGTVEPLRPGIPPGKINSVAVDGDVVRFALKLENGIEFQFEGKLPRAGGKKINGSVSRGGTLNPGYLEATQAKNAFELKKETIARTPNDPRVFATLIELVPMAAKEKVSARDMQELVDGVLQSAESYGPTFQSDFGLKLVDALESSYPAAAIDVAAKVEKGMDPKAPADNRLQLLTTFASSLKKLGRLDEAAKVGTQLDAAERSAFKDYAGKEFDFKVTPSTAKATRPVLVELFTGASAAPASPPTWRSTRSPRPTTISRRCSSSITCTFPGPIRSPGPTTWSEPASTASSSAAHPVCFFNGPYVVKGGGGQGAAEEKFKVYEEYVDKLMKSPVTAKVAATASRKGDTIAIKAEVSEATGKVKLRVVLSEDWVRYKGSNGVRYHRNVVRAMLGGVEGFGFGGKEFTKELTVDLAKLRTDLSASLDAFAEKEEVRFPSNARPMRMQDLHVVAFLQAEDTGEVIAIARTPVRAEGK